MDNANQAILSHLDAQYRAGRAICDALGLEWAYVDLNGDQILIQNISYDRLASFGVPVRREHKESYWFAVEIERDGYTLKLTTDHFPIAAVVAVQ